MAKRYSPSLAISRGSLLMVRPRERVAVENVESYLAGLISSGQIELRRYHPSAAPHPSPAPRSRDEPLVDPVKIEVDDLRWAVARAVSGCERRVARDLADAGYQTYCPLGRRLAQRARIKGTSRRERRIRQFCVFSPYIFVGCPKGLEIGRHTHDKIESVISDSRGPVYVAGRIIAAINDLELAGQWYDTKAWREQTRLTVGAQVRVTDGPFASFHGIIDGLPAEMRVKVSLNLFGRATPVHLDACQLEPV